MTIRRIFLMVSALLVPLPAFAGPQSILNPAGPAADKLTQLGWIVFITFWIVSVVVIGLLVWSVVRRTGSLSEHEPWNEGGGQSWILIGGLAIPFVILSGLYIFSLQRTTAFPLHDDDMSEMHPEILVVGHQWWWEVHYLSKSTDQEFTTASEIHIPTGRPVDIELKSADVIHSFWIPALHGKVQLVPGLTNYVRVEATRPGDFQGECAVYCGEQHAHMRLLVVAQSPKEYAAWRSQQLKPAATPQTPEAQQGETVFTGSACALCHTVRGTEAQGTLGPDLTHLAGRKYIASDSYINNIANLEAWITHAQSLKPGALMPNLTMYTGKDLQELVAYLQQLH
ncbi:MAG TPA: cytochrome c oxidase subunit II [Terriglobia bacterium]|nr:cytochrome c oxidase subunit II [Terriglobia bacterium]